eukprot:scaffold10496_cov71-Skeletonema_marinoi.AAC.2
MVQPQHNAFFSILNQVLEVLQVQKGAAKAWHLSATCYAACACFGGLVTTVEGIGARDYRESEY